MNAGEPLVQYRGDAYLATGESVEVLAWAYGYEHANRMAAAVAAEWPQIKRIVIRPSVTAESTRLAEVVRPLQPRIYVEVPIPWEDRANLDNYPRPTQG